MNTLTGAATRWDAGWYRPAQRLESPNHGPRPVGVVIDLIVLHAISLPPGVYGGRQVPQLFTNQLDWDSHPYFQTIAGLAVSAHFFVQRTGALWQFVSCNRRAWHAGVSHYRGRDNCNDDSIGIELEGLPGDSFEPAQYATLQTVCQELVHAYPIRYMAGHEHIAPGRKTDPGPGLEWSRLQGCPGLDTLIFPPPPPLPPLTKE